VLRSGDAHPIVVQPISSDTFFDPMDVNAITGTETRLCKNRAWECFAEYLIFSISIGNTIEIIFTSVKN
jgi:hypothetical protein